MKNVHIITGGSSGIGLECAKQFTDGVVVITGRNEERLKTAKEELLKFGIEVEYKSSDVSNRDNIKELLEYAKTLGKIKTIVNSAAGLGTRFLPATKAQPKEMLPIVDKPTLQYIIEEAIESGIEEILIITGRNKSSIENHFDKSVELELELEKSGKFELLEEVRKISDMVNIHYIRQKEPKGLGHAIHCAKSFIGNEPFAVLLGDDIVYNPEKPCLKQMIQAYDKYKTSILGVQEVATEDVCKYGIVDGKHIEDRIYTVKDLVEKPSIETAPSNVAILGRYIINPAIFEILEKTKPGKGGEIQLTDGLKELAEKEAMYAYVFEGRRYDVGDKQGFLEATVEFALRREDLREEFLDYLKKVVEKEVDF